MNSYLITGYFILTFKMSTLHPQNGFTKTQTVCKSYAKKKKKRKKEKKTSKSMIFQILLSLHELKWNSKYRLN